MIATASGTEEKNKLSPAAERFCCRFSLADIQLATDDFSEAHLIGNGGFGKVYKGLIDNGQQTVAMKRLALNSSQGEPEFLTEIETLSKLRHVNLVSLIGYCNENEEMILVYEYIAHGTLADHLYKFSGNNDSIDSSDCSALTWKQRLNICIGAGRGLDYLHTGSSIIHRDVKSTNILLDENFIAKVSDFGLAKHLSTTNSKSHISTIVKGSFGYLDPSYFTTCRLTKSSDTYAFGVVLLEVLCGRPAVDPRLAEDEVSLVMWAQENIRRGKVDKIVASNLREEISADCLKTFVGVVKECLHHEPKKRPTMAQAVVQLEYALEQLERKPSRLIHFPNFGGMKYASLFRSKPSTYGSPQSKAIKLPNVNGPNRNKPGEQNLGTADTRCTQIREEPPRYSSPDHRRDEPFNNLLAGFGSHSFDECNLTSGTALYDFTAGSDDDELSLTAGEEVEIEYEVDAWYYVRKKRPGRDGKLAGLVPVLYVCTS